MVVIVGTGQAIVAASVAQQMLGARPQKHVIYLTDRVHLLYQQAATFASQLHLSVGRYSLTGACLHAVLAYMV